MSSFPFVRYGVTSVLVLAAMSGMASCVSGGTDPGAGPLGNGATGNNAGTSTGNQSGSSSIGGSFSTGGNSGHGGSVASMGGSNAVGGALSMGGSAGSSSVGGSNSAGAGGKAMGGSSGSNSSGGSTGMAGAAGGGPKPLDPISGGTSGFATRYWDCCKPACGSSKVSCSSGTNTDGNGNQSACAGGNSYMCYNFEPFVDSSNPYVAYAYAAAHRNCGSCWEIQFPGHAGCSDASNCPGTATGLVYKTLFVQVLNTGSIQDDQFDLLIPGGGVGEFNACSNEWGTSDLGAVYGGFLTGCKGDVTCTRNKCNSVFAGKPDLMAGCDWFLTWYTAADNPQITFKQVSCPNQLSDKSGMSG